MPGSSPTTGKPSSVPSNRPYRYPFDMRKGTVSYALTDQSCHCEEGEARRGNLLVPGTNTNALPGDSHGLRPRNDIVIDALSCWSTPGGHRSWSAWACPRPTVYFNAKKSPGSSEPGDLRLFNDTALNRCTWYSARSHVFYSPIEYIPTYSSLSPGTARLTWCRRYGRRRRPDRG